jgi:ankyrin repeat protein
MDKKLQEACLNGDIEYLRASMPLDPKILLLAIEYNKHDVVKALLDMGIRHKVALNTAALYSDGDMVQLLIDNGVVAFRKKMASVYLTAYTAKNIAALKVFSKYVPPTRKEIQAYLEKHK